MILARFSAWRAAAYIAANIALCCLLAFAVLDHPSNISLHDYILSNQQLHRPLVILGLLASPFLVFILIVIARQIFYRRRAAMWISGDRLFFLNFYESIRFSSMELKNVDSVAVGSMASFRPKGLIIRLKGGGLQYVPSLLLEEGPEVIAARVADIIGSGRS